MKIPDTQIAVTLFNLREHCKTESDLDRTLDRVCGIGYQAVQVSGVALDAEVIARQLERHRLYCCATHQAFEELREIDRLIDRMRTLGCDFFAIGMPGPYRENRFAGLDDYLREVTAAAVKLADAGIRVGYHNHDFEFMKMADGRTVLENLYARSDPALLCAEIDVHWVTRGGGSPVAWIRRVAGRMPVVHFKDFARLEDGPHFCEIGEGNLDWPAILQACRDTGVRFYSVEQDREFPGRDIFSSIEISFRNLKAMGVK